RPPRGRLPAARHGPGRRPRRAVGREAGERLVHLRLRAVRGRRARPAGQERDGPVRHRRGAAPPPHRPRANVPVAMGGLAPDDAAFAARVARLDANALVRVREGRLWAALPIGVLAVRELAGDAEEAVYRAGDLSEGRLAPRPVSEWRGRLPQRPW